MCFYSHVTDSSPPYTNHDILITITSASSYLHYLYRRLLLKIQRLALMFFADLFLHLLVGREEGDRQPAGFMLSPAPAQGVRIRLMYVI